MATQLEKQSEKFKVIEAWRASGLSQQSFCKSQGITYSGFHYWYKKYRQVKSVDVSADFLPVQIKHSVSNLPVVEFILPDGRRLNFYQAVDAAFLQSLLS